MHKNHPLISIKVQKGRANGRRYWRCAGVDSVREQEKLEARKLLEKRAESYQSSVHFVGRFIFFSSNLLASHYVVNRQFDDQILVEFLLYYLLNHTSLSA